MSNTESNTAGAAEGGSLEIKDTRTGTTYSIPIMTPATEGDTAIRAMDLRPIKTNPDEFGLMTYDPAFMNTASCKSAITFIDGDKGPCAPTVQDGRARQNISGLRDLFFGFIDSVSATRSSNTQ